MMLIAFLVSTPAQWPPTMTQVGALSNLPTCFTPCTAVITAQATAATVAGAAANPGLTCDQLNKNLNKCADKCTEAEFKTGLAALLPVYMDATASKTQMDSLINSCKTCFPSDAQVTMVDGMPRRLDALRAGAPSSPPVRTAPSPMTSSLTSPSPMPTRRARASWCSPRSLAAISR